MKIGIYGGSFNPPHNMHLNLALNLIKQHYVDKVIYVPTGNHYPKADLISGKKRVKMLKMVTKPHHNLEVSNFELKKKQVYTYETLIHFKKKYQNDEIYFILGSDLLKEIIHWKNSEYLLNHFKILVILRNNDTLEGLKINHQNIIYTNITLKSLSSTEIREAIKKKNQTFLSQTVDKKVLKYIQYKQLYK